MGAVEYLRRKTTCGMALRYARWQMRRSGLDSFLVSRPKSAISPQAYDLWNLYRTVRRRRPQTTMEFGVGCSTIAIAEALYRNGDGRHTVVEANAQWLDVSRQELPNHLRPFVSYVHSKAVAIEHAGELCHVFSERPQDIVPEFLYVDGPNSDDVSNYSTSLPPMAADPLFMKFAKQALIIVDSRVKNVAFLRRHMTIPYRYSYHDIFGVSRFRL